MNMSFSCNNLFCIVEWITKNVFPKDERLRFVKTLNVYMYNN